jgi:hypothetical protein
MATVLKILLLGKHLYLTLFNKVSVHALNNVYSIK